MRVRGEGPLPCSVCLVGEAPGYKESETGRPFVGKSGIELTRYLERAYLERDDIYVTNLVKLQPPVVNGKQTAPTHADIERDAPELVEELAVAQPRWIGAVGRVAAQWLADVESMEAAHGLAFPLRPEVAKRLRGDAITAARTSAVLAGRTMPSGRTLQHPIPDDDAWIAEVRVVPLHHPAAALHNPELQPLVHWDVQQFSKYVRGLLVPVTPVDDIAEPRYALGAPPWWRKRRIGAIGVDTEGSVTRPWSVQLSDARGTGYVVRANDTEGLRCVQRILDAAEVVVLQHALHDVDVLAAMGLRLDWSRVEDTYIAADVLRLVPRGLKAGARRDCGMQMRGYAEVIAPAERRLSGEWVRGAIEARRCYTCWGRGKSVDEVKVAKRAAQTLATGRTFKTPTEVRCPDCVDGGLWEPRGGDVEYDWERGEYRVRSGWEVQRYLRVLEADIAKGAFDTAPLSDDGGEVEEADSPKKRVRGWPEEVRTQLEAVCGPLPEATLDDVPIEEATRYAARDADATLRRYPILRAQIDELGLYDAYRLDLDVMPIAAEMQRNGMRINRRYFAELSEELKERKFAIAQQLQLLVGRPLNPGSGDQVADLLYTRHGASYSDADERDYAALLNFDLAPEKYTKSGKRGSTDDKTLEGLKLKYAEVGEIVEAITLILDYRMCDKIDGTYAEKLPRVADADDRVHTRIKIGPATFRWASADPNLQNIPTREKHGEDLGRRVRLGFEAAEGRVMGSRDFDQVEMRVLAWYAQDADLLRAFRDGIDIHTMTASKVFRVVFDAVTKAQRTSAKNIGFGIVYGVTARGLKAQMELRGLHWTIEECQALIDSYLYEAYPGVGEFMSSAHAEARRDGMVRSLFGHIRYTSAVHSAIPSIREEALRQAANFKIQCTAAELLKVAMRDLWREAGERLRELDARILMAVHDELLVETPDDEDVRDEVDALMSAYMTNPVPLDGVEITSASKWDRSWGMLK